MLAGVTRGSHGSRRRGAAPVGAKREEASVPQRAALLLSPLRHPRCRGKEGTALVPPKEHALLPQICRSSDERR